MTREGLKYLNDCFEELGLPYSFMVWNADLTFPYFVGEYSEIEPMWEGGLQEGTFLLTGTTNGSYLELEVIKEMIREYFPDTGRTAILPDGSGIAVCYSNSFPVMTGEQGLNRIQINLSIKQWKGC